MDSEKVLNRLESVMMTINNLSIPVGLADQIARPLVGCIAELGYIRDEIAEEKEGE